MNNTEAPIVDLTQVVHDLRDHAAGAGKAAMALRATAYALDAERTYLTSLADTLEGVR